MECHYIDFAGMGQEERIGRLDIRQQPYKLLNKASGLILHRDQA